MLQSAYSQTQGVESVRSQYRRTKHNEITEGDKSETCHYCGKRGHGKNVSSKIRKTKYSAYNNTCNYCHQLHHFELVCRFKEKAKHKSSTPSLDWWMRKVPYLTYFVLLPLFAPVEGDPLH